VQGDVVQAKKMPLGVEVGHALDLDRFLPYRIRKLAAAVSSPRSVAIDGQPVRAREWRVLLVLACFGPMTIKEASQRSVMDAASTTRAVQNLLSLGLVATRTHKSDRRKQIVTLTPEGARAHDEIAPQRQAFSREVMSGLTAQEQDLFFDLIDRIEQTLDETARRDEDPFFED
jgi:DNA-binding MarR family transcriptional regulator